MKHTHHTLQQVPPKLDFTAKTLNTFKTELSAALIERKAIIERLQTAREMGDLSENGAYTYAKKELRSIDRRIAQLNHYLQHGRAIQQTSSTDTVSIGHQVTLKTKLGEVTYVLIGTLEADPLEGKISVVSPLGKALLGKKVGDVITFSTPTGPISHTLIKIAVASL